MPATAASGGRSRCARGRGGFRGRVRVWTRFGGHNPRIQTTRWAPKRRVWTIGAPGYEQSRELLLQARAIACKTAGKGGLPGSMRFQDGGR
jgi:hypothetical protein